MSLQLVARTVIVAMACVGIGACSDIYTERRDTISSTTGDAIAANRVTQMIDPWPRSSANRNIAFSGERMQAAAERYRTGRVIEPRQSTTSSAAYSQQNPQSPAPGAATGQAGSSGGQSR